MLNIVRHRGWFFLASLLIIIPGTIALILWGLRLGVDFTGGTLWQVKFQRPVQVEQVRAVLESAGYKDAQVTSFAAINSASTNQGGTQGVSMRLPPIQQASGEKAKLDALLVQHFGKYTEITYSTVGPAVGSEVARKSIYAVALASLGILGYIAWAFRKVQHPFRYGLAAIIAMLHDVLVVVGIFAILGHFWDVEVDALFVTALLTVIGFSVHDTIVVFDRIRENQLRRIGESFANIVNYSLVQTLVRSLNTSLTVLVTLAALYFFGGVTIRSFVLALLIGIFSGTYSSIFNASLLLVVWENRDIPRIFGRNAGAQPAAV